MKYIVYILGISIVLVSLISCGELATSQEPVTTPAVELPVSSPIATPVPTPVFTPTPSPTPTPLPTPLPTPRLTPSPTPEPTPELTPIPGPSLEPSPRPPAKPAITPRPVSTPIPLVFDLGKWKVIDSNRRAGLEISFTTSKQTGLDIINPRGIRTDRKQVTVNETATILYLGGSRETPIPGEYKIIADDPGGKFQKSISFNGSNLTVVGSMPLWELASNPIYSLLRSLEINLKNLGDLVVYIDEVELEVGPIKRIVRVSDRGIGPQEETRILLTLNIYNVPVQNRAISLILKDSMGNKLADYRPD